MNSAFRVHWSKNRRKTKWFPVSNEVTLKQVKSFFGPLVIQLVWYILKKKNSAQCRWKWWIFNSTSMNNIMMIKIMFLLAFRNYKCVWNSTVILTRHVFDERYPSSVYKNTNKSEQRNFVGIYGRMEHTIFALRLVHVRRHHRISGSESVRRWLIFFFVRYLDLKATAWN